MYWVHLATCNSGATPNVLHCVTRSVLPATGWSRSLMDYDPPLFEGTSSQVETRIQGGNRVSLTVNVKGTSFQQCHFVWRNELRSFHAIQLDSARRRSLASTLFIRWVQADTHKFQTGCYWQQITRVGVSVLVFASSLRKLASGLNKHSTQLLVSINSICN